MVSFYREKHLQKIKVQQLAELLQKRTHANTSSPDMEAIEGNPWEAHTNLVLIFIQVSFYQKLPYRYSKNEIYGNFDSNRYGLAIWFLQYHSPYIWCL